MARRESDYSEWASVIAVDPGGTTGWSVLSVHPEAMSDSETMILANIEHWAQGQVAGHEFKQAREIIDLCEAWPHAAIVIEDFILRRLDRGRDLLSPVRLTAMIEFMLHDVEDRHVFKQQPSEAKSVATDDRLKSWGLYRREGGEEHARDATRHAITFLRRAKEKPKLRAAAWPDKYDPRSGDLTWPVLSEA